MKNCILKILLILVLILNAFSISYAQKDPELFNGVDLSKRTIDPALKDAIFMSPITRRKNEEKKKSFFSFFKSKAFAAAKDKTDDRKQIREEWNKLLGIDIFYPYFKAKEIEHVVQEKAGFKVFDMKGRPEFNDDYNEVDYIFKKRF